MRRYYILSAAIAIFCCINLPSAFSQDARFSQFYNAPLHLNPAMTGVFDGSWRLAVNYRDQWASILNENPYRTLGASFDYRFNVIGNDYIAVGLHAVSNQTGISSFQQNEAHLSLSFLKQLSGGYGGASQYLVAGVQGGFGQNRIDPSGLWFSQQYNVVSETLDLSQPTGENFDGMTDAFLNINAGLLWYAVFEDNFSIHAGGSINHVNAPRISFMGDNDAILPMRWVGHIGGEIPFTPELSLMPAIAIMGQGSSNSFTLGANIRYSNHDWNEVAVRIGGWTHISNDLDAIHNDAFTVAAILEIERLNVGISYDINTSSLVAATNSRGTYELSLIYSRPENRRFKVTCPKF